MKVYIITVNGPLQGQEVLCKGIRPTDQPLYFMHINNLVRNDKNHSLVFLSEEELQKFHEFQTDGYDQNEEFKGFGIRYWNKVLSLRIGCFMQAKSIEF